MIQLTLQEIAHYRSQLANYPEVLVALDELENCDGDLEDAAINLAIHIGQQPDRGDWLDGIAKRCRVEICQEEFQEDLLSDRLNTVVDYLIESKTCSAILAAPIVLYVLKTGVENFCKPLSFKHEGVTKNAKKQMQ